MKRNYPDFINAYSHYTSLSEAPDKFHIWTAVSVIAGALRRKVYISQGYFEWVPNFYIILVAPPGIVSKSTTSNIGMKLLREVPDIKFGPNIVTWQALATSFAKAAEVLNRKNGAVDSMAALTIHSSELGNLIDPTERAMVDLLVNLWDGDMGAVEKQTKTMGGDSIKNPYINIIGCTTPHWISGSFPEYMIGGGFTSRCIFVYGEEKRQLVAYPGRMMRKDADLNGMRMKLIEDLIAIAAMEGEFHITDEAYAWGEGWYHDMYEKLKKCTDTRMQGYYARKQTHIHKLAMILSAAESDSLVITPLHLSKADVILTAMESDMAKTFHHIGLTNETRAIEQLIQLVLKVGHVSVTEAYRGFSRQLTATGFGEVVQSAINTGYVRTAVEAGVHTLYAVRDTLAVAS